MFDKSAREKSQNARTTVCKTGLKIEIGQFESVRRGSREWNRGEFQAAARKGWRKEAGSKGGEVE